MTKSVIVCPHCGKKTRKKADGESVSYYLPHWIIRRVADEVERTGASLSKIVEAALTKAFLGQ